MWRLVVLGLWTLVGAAVAGEVVEISPRLEPGAVYEARIERRQELFVEDAWLPEGAARLSATLEVVEARADGYVLRWTVERITTARREAQDAMLAEALTRLPEGLVLEVAVRPGEGLRLLNREAVRAFLGARLEGAVSRLRTALLERGFPEQAVGRVLDELASRMRANFSLPAEDFDRLQLRDLAPLFELAGARLESAAPLSRVEPRPFPQAGRDLLPAQVEERLVETDADRGLWVVERVERPLEAPGKEAMLRRFPSLMGELRRLPEPARERVIARLPEPELLTRTRYSFARGDGLPVLVHREDLAALGSLARRQVTTVELAPQTP